MKPIGQTFYVNEPTTGVAGVYLTKVDIFFKSVSSVYGIELQIRTTLNGVPTQERLPFASKILYPTDIAGSRKALLPSDNGSIASTFIFDTPQFLQAGNSYAIVLIPLGGNPDYQIWTGEIGQNDPLNGPIYTNNETGDLFLSSNDKDWIPVITEDMKFKIYIANFTSLGGTATFTSPNEDYFEIYGVCGSFFPGEPVYPSNGQLDIAVLNVSGVQGTFASGDVVYQNVASTNTATGVVYSSSSSVVKVKNVTGSFSSVYKLYNSSSVSNAAVTSVSQNAISTSVSSTLTVPDSSLFATNEIIYISTSNYSVTKLFTVTSIPTTTSIVVNNAIGFDDNHALYGKILFNGTLKGGLGGLQVNQDFTRIILDSVTSTTSNNFNSANTSIGSRIIGQYSGASAYINKVVDVPYNQISPQITNITPANTNIDWAFKGVENAVGYANDAFMIPIHQGISNELIDHERVLVSRSNELTNMPAGRTGERSIQLQASMSSSNTKVSPVIDVISKLTHTTKNLAGNPDELSGYYLTISNTNGSFSNGDYIYQNSTTATVRAANSTFMMVTNVPPGTFFNANSVSVINGTNSGNATIVTAEYFDETQDNGFFRSSRYISKNIVLASTQSSEDILVYLAAYRPVQTNLDVYVKLINDQDADSYDSKAWSYLPERTSGLLLSSQVNINDQLELSYGFPQSLNLFISNTVCNTSSNTVTVYSSADISVGQYVYISGGLDDDTPKFIVRHVTSIVNSTAIEVSVTPSFNSNSSVNTGIGIIPGLRSATGAFLYDQNSNIVRYVTSNDLVYDSYSQFSIKIVPTSNNHGALVPRVGDMRVLALQA